MKYVKNVFIIIFNSNITKKVTSQRKLQCFVTLVEMLQWFET